jgi:hypothetical protein
MDRGGSSIVHEKSKNKFINADADDDGMDPLENQFYSLSLHPKNTNWQISPYIPPQRVPAPLVYKRSEYLKQCESNAHKGLGLVSRTPLRFFLYGRETIYKKKHFQGVSTNDKDQTKHHFSPDNYFEKHGKVKVNGVMTRTDKDVIMLRGRTLEGDAPVFAFLEYDHAEFSPCFYVEAMEGFDNSSYTELPEVIAITSKHNLSISQSFGGGMATTAHRKPDGVDKFIRWIQNYMFYALSSGGRNGHNGHQTEECLIDPSIIISYAYMYNHPGAKTIYGYTPEPSQGGPNRYFIKVCCCRLLHERVRKRKNMLTNFII